MSEEISCNVIGELRPSWMLALKAVLWEAHERGYHVVSFEDGTLRLDGGPYIFAGEPRTRSWTTDVPTALDE